MPVSVARLAPRGSGDEGAIGRGNRRPFQSTLHRPRLEALLNEWAPLTGIWGLPGSGKTTLVASWLDALDPHGIRVLYCVADRLVDDWFSREVRAALHRGPDAEVGRSPITILDDAAAELGPDRRLILIIEDAHYFTEQRMLRDLISLLRRRNNIHIITCSPGRHPLLDLAVGMIDHVEISPSDLQLTPDETHALAVMAGSTRSREAHDVLHTTYGGWLVPTQLALADDGDGSGRDLPFRFLHLHMLPALAELDDESYAMARRLSHAGPDLDVALLRALGITARHEEILVTFGILLPTASGYVIADAVRRALVEASHREDAASAAPLHREIATWWRERAVKNNDTRAALNAFSHAVRGKDWELAMSIWARFESRLCSEYPLDYVALLNAIPSSVIDAHPAWQVSRAAMRTGAAEISSGDQTITMATVAAHIQAVRQVQFDKDDLNFAELLYLGSYRLMERRTKGHIAADAYGQLLDECVQERFDRAEHAGDRLPFYYMNRGIDRLMLGDSIGAIRFFTDAVRIPVDQSAAHHRAWATAALAESYAIRGDSAHAADALATYRELTNGVKLLNHPISQAAELAAGLRALDRLDGDAARAELDTAWSRLQSTVEWPYFSQLRARYELHFGDPRSALSFVLAAREGERSHPDHLHDTTADTHVADVLIASQAELLTALGRAQAALTLLKDRDPLHPDIAVALATATLALHLPEAAQLAISRLADVSLAPRQELQLVLLDAAAALELGDERYINDRLARADNLYAHTRDLSAFRRVPTPQFDELVGRFTALTEEDRARLCAARAVFPANQSTLTLTPRERDLAEALVRGVSRTRIAKQLYLSINTVKKQLSALYRKLDVSTREQAVEKIRDLALLEGTHQ